MNLRTMEQSVLIDLWWEGRSAGLTTATASVLRRNYREQPDVRCTSRASSSVDRAPVARSACRAGVWRLLADAPVALLRHTAGRWSSRPRAARPDGRRRQHQCPAQLSQFARLHGAWLEPGTELRPPYQPRARHVGPHRRVVRVPWPASDQPGGLEPGRPLCP